MAMELELHLDANGRTTFDKEKVALQHDCYEKIKMDYSSKTVMTNLGRQQQSMQQQQQQQQQQQSTQQHTPEKKQFLDTLLFDCEIADCGLLPRTFWMPADGSNQPRCALEQMALDVFHRHVSPSTNLRPNTTNFEGYDPSTSGAEWWVQIRPSPPGIGRYAMQEQDEIEDKSDAKDLSKSGISFHWDKDEELRLLTGGTMFIHPHISTVTYLTDLGPPTMVLNARVNNFTGEWILPKSSKSMCTTQEQEQEHTTGACSDHDDDDEKSQKDRSNDNFQAFVSWPQQGKHLSFDGRFLHAAPPDFMEDGQFESQCYIPAPPSAGTSRPTGTDIHTGTYSESNLQQQQQYILEKRRHRRVTFLVNIWLNYKPMDVQMFPESMLDKLSKISSDEHFAMFPKQTKTDGTVHRLVIQNSFATTLSNVLDKKTNKIDTGLQPVIKQPTKLMKWPLGGCGTTESLQAKIPLDEIRKKSNSGGSIYIDWVENDKDGVQTKSETSTNANSTCSSSRCSSSSDMMNNVGICLYDSSCGDNHGGSDDDDDDNDNLRSDPKIDATCNRPTKRVKSASIRRNDQPL